MYYYKISEMENTFHLIDSVVILDSLITNVDSTRIRLMAAESVHSMPVTVST